MLKLIGAVKKIDRCQTLRPHLSVSELLKKLIDVRNVPIWSSEELRNLTGPSVRCQICQIWQNSEKDSEKNVHLSYALMPWFVKFDTCLIRLTFFGGFWQSAHPGLLFHWRETNSFFLSPPPLSCSCSGGVSLSLYSQKAQIPGLRECMGVIIPNPCTLNGTFHRDLNILPVVPVA